MDINQPCPMAVELAARIREARTDLTARWLERIATRVQLEPERPFPSEELLDHGPVLLDGIADYLADPSDEITADIPVIAKAMELGELRFAQGFDASEILKEYEILGGVLFSFSSRVVAERPEACAPAELLECTHRLFRAISVIEQVTTGQYVRTLGERVGEREERLRRFNRMLTHELKNRVSATLGAGQLLQEEWLGTDERQRFAAMVTENAQEIQKVLENLIALSRLEGERRRERNIQLREAVTEVFRQLRELSRARGVELRIASELPDAQVNAAAVELCLSTYVSNAIRYADMNARERWVQVEAALEPLPTAQTADDGELVIRVRDNGMGVAPEQRGRLFERVLRTHPDTAQVEGTGLGLSLVQEAVTSLGGRAWVEFEETPGSVFVFALPCRRGADRVSGASARSLAEQMRRRDAAPVTVSD